MKIFLTALFITHLSLPVYAQDVVIAFVKRDIPLSDSDPVFKDYYLSSTENLKFKRDQVVNVVRTTTVKDQSGTQLMGSFEIPIGQLKVIDIQGKIAVAREVKLISREDRALIDQPGFLMGDKVVP